jgi:hypothetical protein
MCTLRRSKSTAGCPHPAGAANDATDTSFAPGCEDRLGSRRYFGANPASFAAGGGLPTSFGWPAVNLAGLPLLAIAALAVRRRAAVAVALHSP